MRVRMTSRSAGSRSAHQSLRSPHKTVTPLGPDLEEDEQIRDVEVR